MEPMTIIQRLQDLLKVAGKVRGLKTPVYREDGALDHYSRQMVEVEAGDLAELAAMCPDGHDSEERAGHLHKGSKCHPPETKVTVYADHLHELIEAAQGKPAPTLPG